MWPIFICVTHINKCGPSLHLSPIFIPVAHLYPCRLSLYLSPIFTPVAHLYTCHPSLHLSPIFIPVAHLYTCHPSLHLSPIFIPVAHLYTCRPSLHLCHCNYYTTPASGFMQDPIYASQTCFGGHMDVNCQFTNFKCVWWPETDTNIHVASFTLIFITDNMAINNDGYLLAPKLKSSQ